MKIKCVLIILALFLAISAFSLAASAESNTESVEASVEESAPQEETVGGISMTAWTVITVGFVALVAYATYSAKFKKK